MAGPGTLYQEGDHASRPASGAGCVLYACTDHGLVYRDDGSSWSTWATLGGDLSAHTGDTSDAHDASAISFTPAGTIAATDVQAAIEEVASEAGGAATTPIWEQIYELFDTNTDPVDALITSGDYRVFVYFGSQNAASWKAATNATLTVPASKKLVCIQAMTHMLGRDTTARRVRLYNSTDAAEVVPYQVFANETSGFFAYTLGMLWRGDASDPSRMLEVATGKTVRMEVWNQDTTKRSMGGLVIARLLDA